MHLIVNLASLIYRIDEAVWKSISLELNIQANHGMLLKTWLELKNTETIWSIRIEFNDILLSQNSPESIYKYMLMLWNDKNFIPCKCLKNFLFLFHNTFLRCIRKEFPDKFSFFLVKAIYEHDYIRIISTLLLSFCQNEI